MTESAFQLDLAGTTVRGMLHRPAGSARVPAVLWLHDFARDRNGNQRAFLEGARRLAERGIASLRLDFRGCGESGGDSAETSLRSMVEDARAALAALRADSGIDAERLAIVGESLGAAVASQLADEPGIAGIVMWSPIVFPVPIFARMGLYAAHPELSRQGWIDHQGHRVGREFLSELTPLDPLSALANWSKPLVVLYGGEDMVATSENPEALLSEIPGARGECLPDADHVFGTVAAKNWLLDRTETALGTLLAGMTVT